VIPDPAGDSAECANPAAGVSDNPADLLNVTVESIQNGDGSLNSYLVEVQTSTPMQELIQTSYSAALVINAVTYDGERINIKSEVHDGMQTIGLMNDNNQLIPGTGSLVGSSNFGMTQINLPANTYRLNVQSFYSNSAQTAPICDSVETVSFLDRFLESETLGELLDRLELDLCPPLDELLNVDMPLDERSAAAALFGLLLTPSFAEFGTALRLFNPNFPYDPLSNPIIIVDGCLGAEQDS
jgi:hypothetical protein